MRPKLATSAFFTFLLFLVLFPQNSKSLFAFSLWTKQKLISELTRHYIIGCRNLAIVNGVEPLREAIQMGQMGNPQFLESVDIYVDLGIFCERKDLIGSSLGITADCFQMPKNSELKK